MSIIATTLAATTLGLAPSIDDYVQSSLKDVSFTASVAKSSQTELKKINNDFASAYRFNKTSVMLKEPFKLRMEAKVEDMDILFIVNGGTKAYKIPSRGLSRKENVSKAPGKRQTAFDFGILTPALFSNYYSAKFVREDSRTGMTVFDVTYVASLNDKTRHRIWVDDSKKFVSRREWYGQDGFLKATFEYTNPSQVGGVWVPTSLTVKNSENKFSGQMSYTNFKVNSGLNESLFSL